MQVSVARKQALRYGRKRRDRVTQRRDGGWQSRRCIRIGRDCRRRPRGSIAKAVDDRTQRRDGLWKRRDGRREGRRLLPQQSRSPRSACCSVQQRGRRIAQPRSWIANRRNGTRRACARFRKRRNGASTVWVGSSPPDDGALRGVNGPLTVGRAHPMWIVPRWPRRERR